MHITLNGEPHEFGTELPLAALVEQLELSGKRFAIEVNAEVVPRSSFEAFRLSDGDRVEIVHAIGGG